MANGVLEILGLSHIVADAGLPISSIPLISGSKGIVTDFSIIWGGDGLPPLDSAISLQGFPYAGAGAIATGTDSNGSIGVAKSFTINNDAGTSWSTTSGLVTLANGCWAQNARVFISDITGTRRIRIDILVLVLTDLTQSLVDNPSNLVDSNPTWNPTGGPGGNGQGNVDLNWTFSNSLAENPSGFAIVREKTNTPTSPVEIIGTVPWVNGITTYSYTDYLFLVGTYSYYIIIYKNGSPNKKSPPNTPVVVVIGGSSPGISVTSDMSLAFEWSSVMAFITNPSGIYGLISNKTHDTLYNRAVETSVNMKIPNPFAKTSFLPEE